MIALFLNGLALTPGFHALAPLLGGNPLWDTGQLRSFVSEYCGGAVWMKRHASLIPLSHDHQRSLALAVMIDRRSQPDEELVRKAIAMWEGELRDHFVIEERDVFPLARGERALVEQLVGEHRELERLVGELAAVETPRDKLEEFGRLLSAHIRSEERRLFEAMQGDLSEEEMSDLGRRIHDAHRPPTCDLT